MAGTERIDEVIFTSGLIPRSAAVWRGIEYGWADYRYKSGAVVARYLFTYTDAPQWNMLYERQVDFVSEIIEPAYFQQADDVSWNLYWVTVLPEDQLSQLDLQRRLVFSSNTEFTRNLVVSLERLPECVPVGRASAVNTAEESVQPAGVWMEALEPAGLAFCLGEYSSKALSDYIESGTCPKYTQSEQKAAEAQQCIRKIQKIAIPQNFRPHYYPKDWSIPLAPVNLLYGPNGTGKTSLLSAVEAAWTGEIYTNGGANQVAPDSGLELLLETDQGEITVRPARDYAEKKRREQIWYLNRGNNRTKPQLNEAFHQYNYFSTDEAFLFTSQHRNYCDVFAKILYGPSTDELWRSRNRYLEECIKLGADLEAKQQSLRERLVSLRKVPLADRFVLNTILASSGLAIDPGLPLEEILKMAQTALTEYIKLQGDRLVPSRKQEEQKERLIPSREQAEQNMIRLKKELEEDQAREEELKNEFARLRGADTFLLTVERCFNEQKAMLDSLASLKQRLEFMMEHQAEMNAYDAAQTQKSNIENQLRRLESLILEYSEGIIKKPPHFSPAQARKHMERLRNRRAELKESLDALNERIDKEQRLADQRFLAMDSLHTAGVRLYNTIPGLNACPLCGTKGITQSVLLAHMQRERERERMSGRDSLTKLLQKSDQIKDILEENQVKMANMSAQLDLATKYDCASKAILAQFPELKDPADIFALADTYRSDLSKSSAHLSQLKAELQAMTAEQLGTAELMDSKQLRMEIKAFLPSRSRDAVDGMSDTELLTAISDLQCEVSNNILKTRRLLLEFRTDLQQSELVYKQCCAAAKQVSEKKDELSRQERAKEFWDKIQFIVEDPYISAESIGSLCGSIVSVVRKVMEYDEYAIKQNEYHVKMRRIQEKLERCRLLQGSLEQLQPPEVYAQRFIQQNIAQISQIFCSLHQPQEFSKLGIGPDNSIAGYRGEDIVSVDQMSTGQRTALVLSVFFQMNLTASYTPAFLLLDEPVANIDDLNVLALIDFLREFAITHHRQIIVTTANRNVAKLFRRKFSFLSEHYQELCFYREQELQLRIVRRCYSQQRALPEQEL